MADFEHIGQSLRALLAQYLEAAGAARLCAHCQRALTAGEERCECAPVNKPRVTAGDDRGRA